MSWSSFFGGGNSNVPWKELKDLSEIQKVLEVSKEKPQLIFKHSTRCSISSMAKSRLEREWNLEGVDPWYLDLLANRVVSNNIASQFGVQHQSPQVIVLKDGKVIYEASHSTISVPGIKQALS